MGSRFRTLTLWAVIVLSFLLLLHYVKNQKQAEDLSLSELIALGDKGRPQAVAAPGDAETPATAAPGVAQTAAPQATPEAAKTPVAPAITEAPKTPEGATDAAKAPAGPRNSIVLRVTDHQGMLDGEYVSPGTAEKHEFQTEYNNIGGQGRSIYDWAIKNGILYTVVQPSIFLREILPQIVMLVVLLGVAWLFLSRQLQSGSNKAMSFGKSRARLVTEGQIKVTFADVAGIDEVREELQEVIQFLANPAKFSRLGAKIPRGVLLYGPPGTGKTLIARATAGEASVPFFNISGSDFVEMFVGVGASRVRDLFEQGKKAKPCLIYIDEIDAVGRSRFSGWGGGHDEREQTLNQLLVELDGFTPNEGVIVMASTNRPDVLDPALLRPGRFDRQIRVDLPDIVGREKILEVHTKGVQLASGVDLKQIAKGTPGFSGADLANLVNEGALLAARDGKKNVELVDLEEAKDRVMMGPARRSMAMSEKEKTQTAYHEAGHALVAKKTNNTEHRVHKVTIIPRGRSLGATSILPEDDNRCQDSVQLRQALIYMMGGRAAEEVVLGVTTTGAANDLQRATELAHRMTCEFGMSEKLGPRTFGAPSAPMFMGRDMGHERDYSEAMASAIDAEVQSLLMGAYEEARNILATHRDELERITRALLERETLTGEDLDALLRGETLAPLLVNDKGSGGTPASPVAEMFPAAARPETIAPMMPEPHAHGAAG
jgi:cell division protease FtsH